MTNATRLISRLTEMAVRKVSENNEGRYLTEEQFEKRVENLMKNTLTQALDQIEKTDPVAAERVSRELENGLA